MKALITLISSLIILTSCQNNSDNQSKISELNYFRSVYNDSLTKAQSYVDTDLEIWSSQHSINNPYLPSSVTMDSVEIMTSFYRSEYRCDYFKEQINKIDSQLLALHSLK